MEPLWRRTGLPVPREAVERELLGLRLGGPSGEGPLFRFRALHLNRQVFDRIFAERAAQAGTIVHSGVRVTGALPSGRVLTEDGPMRAAVTIFADGAGSPVRKVMPTVRNLHEVAWGLAQLLEAPGLGESLHFEVRFGSFAPGWRAQFNPLGGDYASVWTFARGVSQAGLEGYAARVRWAFLGAEGAKILEERRGVDPAFVVPHRIAGDGVMACGAAAGQGGLEHGARAGLLAGEVAARAVRAGDSSRRTLKQYEKTWRRETVAEARALRWGMEALRRLSDTELDELFRDLSGVELGEEDLLALLRGDPRGALRKVRLERSVETVMRLIAGMDWSHQVALAAARSKRTSLRPPSLSRARKVMPAVVPTGLHPLEGGRTQLPPAPPPRTREFQRYRLRRRVKIPRTCEVSNAQPPGLRFRAVHAIYDC